jgi:aryl-alcohol dehydrogenase-like predicted oxidoreductase
MAFDFSFPHRLGFGCSGALAARWHSAEKAMRVLRTALKGGIRHFDTAGFYAGGEAERRLGAALAEMKYENVFVSTKTGTTYDFLGRAKKDFTERTIRRDVDASLFRLRRQQLDLVYLHGPTSEQEDQGLGALSRLKDQGKIRFAGICGAGEGLARAARRSEVDVVMGVYNFLRREHADAFAAAKRAGKGVVAIAPLAQGLYDRKLSRPTTPAGAWRFARALVKNRSELRKARSVRAFLESDPAWAPAQIALAFVHANPDIDVAVTTTTSIAHLAQTLAIAGERAGPELGRRLALLDAALSGA